ncbi:hypothetical protein BH10PLA2_BH10PLA2_00700 [soil metagenome]
MSDLGELVVRIKADATGLQQELQRATATAKQASEGMAGAFGTVKTSLDSVRGALALVGIGFGALAIIDYGRKALEVASNTQDFADRIGFAASTLSALRPALASTGTDIGTFAMSVNLMNNAIGMAAKGNVESIKRFDELGLSVSKLKALSPEQQFYAIVDSLGKLKTQYEQTEAGRAIFGRGFAAIIPLIKESNGAVGEHVKKQKELSSVLTDAQIKRVDDFGDAMEEAGIKTRDTFIGALADVLRFFDRLDAKLKEHVHADNAISQRYGLDRFGYKLQDDSQGKWEAKSKAKGYATGIGKVYDSQFGPPAPDQCAKGNNNDILPPKPTSELKEYIANLKGEADALANSKDALEQYKAEKEASAHALADYNNKLRATKDLTEDEKQSVDDITKSYETAKKAVEEATKAQQEAVQMAAQMKAEIASAMADIIVNFQNMKSTVTNVLQQIAKQITEIAITKPLTNSVSSYFTSGSGSSILSSLTSFLPHFAAGGSPPVGSPSLVGEQGPELFVPRTSGSIIPNHALGGQSITVVQNWNVSPGVQGTVEAEIRRAAPAIINQSVAATMQAIQRGGAEARIVGTRQ